MQDFTTMDLDSMMKDIIDIFNLEGVELVRLSGLLRRESKISNCQVLDEQLLKRIIQKLRLQNIIKYRYVMKCPHCQEVSYQITERNPTDLKICDTCGQMYIPTKGVSLFDLENISESNLH